MYRVRKTITIHATPEFVYRKARDPKFWGTWFTGLIGPKALEGDGSVGTVVEYAYALAGLEFPLTIEVTDDVMTPKYCRSSGTIKGPFSGTQTFEYVETEDGTEVTLEMAYTIPGSALARMANILVIESMEERSAELTLENLKLLCELEAVDREDMPV